MPAMATFLRGMGARLRGTWDLFNVEHIQETVAVAQSTTKLLRMREVCARTGLARSTIHHYIREGILPKPQKTGRNTAFYDEDFVRRAQLVKTLQEKTHMPLASIRETLNSMPDAAIDRIDPDRFTGVTRTIADSLRLASERELSRAELIERSGLSALELNGMAAVGLIDPIERNSRTSYSPLDARIVLAFARIREAGATPERGFGSSPEIVEAYREHLGALARVEVKLMVRMMRSLTEVDLDEFVEQTAEPLGDLIAALHRKALVQAVTGVIANGSTQPRG
jgi:DNA-binding transcriptional MerR regulator